MVPDRQTMIDVSVGEKTLWSQSLGFSFDGWCTPTHTCINSYRHILYTPLLPMIHTFPLNSVLPNIQDSSNLLPLPKSKQQLVPHTVLQSNCPIHLPTPCSSSQLHPAVFSGVFSNRALLVSPRVIIPTFSRCLTPIRRDQLYNITPPRPGR